MLIEIGLSVIYYWIYVFNESRTVMYIGMGCYNRQQYYCDGDDDIDELLFILFV